MGDIVMLITHLLKWLDYIAVDGIKAVPFERIPAVAVAWAQYIAKLIRIYATVFFGG